MICSKCNENNPEDSLFCNKCGASLTTNVRTFNNVKSKHKKIIVSIVIGICIIGIGLGGYAYSKQRQQVVKNSDVKSNSVQTNNKQDENKSNQSDNKVNDIDLGILTKQEFEQALLKGKEYKSKETFVEGINQITKQTNSSISEQAISFLITNPYKMVVDISKQLTERYIEANGDNFKNEYIQQKEKYDLNLNTFRCMANLVGENMNFIKDTHMVLKVYGKSNTKILQPIKSNNTASPEIWRGGNGYFNSILVQFDVKEIQELEPQQLEIIVIYPDGKEVNQKFDYNKLNNF